MTLKETRGNGTESLPPVEREMVKNAVMVTADAVLLAASDETPGHVLLYMALSVNAPGHVALCVPLDQDLAELIVSGLRRVLDSPEFKAAKAATQP